MNLFVNATTWPRIVGLAETRDRLRGPATTVARRRDGSLPVTT